MGGYLESKVREVARWAFGLDGANGGAAAAATDTVIFGGQGPVVAVARAKHEGADAQGALRSVRILVGEVAPEMSVDIDGMRGGWFYLEIGHAGSSARRAVAYTC